MWNRAFFREIFVEDGKIIRYEYEEPFASLLGSHKGQIVVLRWHHANTPLLVDGRAPIALVTPNTVLRRGDGDR